MDLHQLMANQSDVSLSIFRHVSLSELANNKNLVLSPLSLNVLISLIAAGAGGPAREQLLAFLKSDSIDDVNSLSSELVSVVFADGSPAGGPKLSIGNGVWVQKDLPFKPSFQHVVQNFYKAESFHVDFLSKAKEVVSQVNSWAQSQTNGLIKEIIGPDSVDSSTRLILANALYFKGIWDNKFDASETKDYDFHLIDGDSVKAPFMTSEKKQFIRIFDSFKVLRLPYKKGQGDPRQFSMYIFLPQAIDGLPALVEKLGSEIGFTDKHLPCAKLRVGEFRLPKFKITFGFETAKTLKALGASSIFSSGGLTEMVDSVEEGKELYVSEIYHKACIEVNEEGTEAAAVSVGVIMLQCYRPPEPPVDFVADRPFMYMIREDTTGVVLFMGHVLNPLVE